jgi:acetoacetate decarboxylase
MLKANISYEISQITPHMLQNVMQNVTKRARICDAARGGHLADIVFHTYWQGLNKRTM